MLKFNFRQNKTKSYHNHQPLMLIESYSCKKASKFRNLGAGHDKKAWQTVQYRSNGEVEEGVEEAVH